jgi:hypothetical protein
LDFGVLPEDILRIRDKAASDSVRNALEVYRNIVERDINAKGIPTLIFGGRKHTGLYE